jgi:hypothetical protein
VGTGVWNRKLTRCAIKRAHVDKGNRGRHTPQPHCVFISGQKRGVFGRIKRGLRRRSAIEAVIGHMKTDGHLGCCDLKGRAGDAVNAVLSAVGYNFRLVLAWLRALLTKMLGALLRHFLTQLVPNWGFLTAHEPGVRSFSRTGCWPACPGLAPPCRPTHGP